MENKELIQKMREEFNHRCIIAYDQGSTAFFDNLDESTFWIDTLITAVREDTSKHSKEKQ